MLTPAKAASKAAAGVVRAVRGAVRDGVRGPAEPGPQDPAAEDQRPPCFASNLLVFKQAGTPVRQIHLVQRGPAQPLAVLRLRREREQPCAERAQQSALNHGRPGARAHKGPLSADGDVSGGEKLAVPRFPGPVRPPLRRQKHRDRVRLRQGVLLAHDCVDQIYSRRARGPDPDRDLRSLLRQKRPVLQQDIHGVRRRVVLLLQQLPVHQRRVQAERIPVQGAGAAAHQVHQRAVSGLRQHPARAPGQAFRGRKVQQARHGVLARLLETVDAPGVLQIQRPRPPQPHHRGHAVGRVRPDHGEQEIALQNPASGILLQPARPRLLLPAVFAGLPWRRRQGNVLPGQQSHRRGLVPDDRHQDQDRRIHRQPEPVPRPVDSADRPGRRAQIRVFPLQLPEAPGRQALESVLFRPADQHAAQIVADHERRQERQQRGRHGDAQEGNQDRPRAAGLDADPRAARQGLQGLQAVREHWQRRDGRRCQGAHLLPQEPGDADYVIHSKQR
ncbi:hypothetical protein KL921_005256 [Ogataea angusta]|nr:hypothetical protein KL921_005256 [Ogataea angusta]